MMSKLDKKFKDLQNEVRLELHKNGFELQEMYEENQEVYFLKHRIPETIINNIFSYNYCENCKEFLFCEDEKPKYYLTNEDVKLLQEELMLVCPTGIETIVPSSDLDSISFILSGFSSPSMEIWIQEPKNVIRILEKYNIPECTEYWNKFLKLDCDYMLSIDLGISFNDRLVIYLEEILQYLDVEQYGYEFKGWIDEYIQK